MTLTLSGKRITRLLVAVVLFLTLASLAGQFSKYRLGHDHLLGFVPSFDLDSELAIPSWYQASSLLLCSALLGWIAVARKRQGDPYARHWTVLAILFLVLSIDEGAALHETLIKPLRDLLHAGGFLYFTWVVPGGAFALLVAVVYLRFLAHLPAVTRTEFVLAAALYVGGALGLEMVGGRYAESHGFANLSYALIANAEEFLEMAGIVVFINALLRYGGSHAEELHVSMVAE